MAISLTPQTRNGIMVWTPSTLLLHLLWSWQLLVSCAGEVFLLFAISYLTSSPNYTRRGLGWLWLFFILTLFLAITVVAEICLYANAQLSPNLFLALQTAKLFYALLVFSLFFVFSNIPHGEDVWHFVIGIVLYWPSWILTFSIAILIKLTEPTLAQQKSAENGNAEAAPASAPERQPLLPSQIPSPRLPSQRVAVQRYPSH